MKASSPKIALITGASSGFGLLTSVTLARRGWHVLATMRDISRRHALEQSARTAGVFDRIEILQLDVTKPDQIAEVAAEVSCRAVPLDALVNNAGFAVAGFADDVSDTELRLQFDTNFFGAAAVTRALLPQFRRQRSGHVVMLSSISGRMGFPGVGSYCAAKHALEGWTETLRFEMLPLGVKVVLVEPGSFETAIWTRGAVIAKGLQDPASPNAAHFARWRSRLQNGNRRANPQIVADGIARILDNPRPQLRYVFGRDAKMGLLLRRLLPRAAFERFVVKSSGLDEERDN